MPEVMGYDRFFSEPIFHHNKDCDNLDDPSRCVHPTQNPSSTTTRIATSFTNTLSKKKIFASEPIFHHNKDCDLKKSLRTSKTDYSQNPSSTTTRIATKTSIITSGVITLLRTHLPPQQGLRHFCLILLTAVKRPSEPIFHHNKDCDPRAYRPVPGPNAHSEPIFHHNKDCDFTNTEEKKNTFAILRTHLPPQQGLRLVPEVPALAFQAPSEPIFHHNKDCDKGVGHQIWLSLTTQNPSSTTTRIATDTIVFAHDFINSLRTHLPPQQGLRLKADAFDIILKKTQNPSSTTTRIATEGSKGAAPQLAARSEPIFHHNKDCDSIRAIWMSPCRMNSEPIFHHNKDCDEGQCLPDALLDGVASEPIFHHNKDCDYL